LLAAVRAFIAQGDAAVSDAVRADPDLSLSGTLMWCARMPASLAETRAQWGALKLRFA
jgi:hypothetical protein